MNETQFQGWVIEVAERFGWRVWHVPFPVRPVGGGQFVPETRAKGLPDLFLLHEDPARMILAELKAKGKKVEDAQREFLDLAQGVRSAIRMLTPDVWPNHPPLGVYVWRPGDEERIEAILRSKVLS